MTYIVIGCGRVGAELADRLSARGIEVAIVDREPAAFLNLSPNFRGRTLEGDALDRNLLERAGIEGAEAMAAVTDSDTLNAVLGHVARVAYRVPHVVVGSFDPRHRPLFEALALQTVSAGTWGAQRIEELMMHGGPQVVYEAGNGEIGVYEFKIPPGWDGRPLQDLLTGFQALPVSLTRAGRAELPGSGTRLQAGDVVHVSATLDGIQALEARLAGN
jgi:trk system potassium uptake protein TrkA